MVKRRCGAPTRTTGAPCKRPVVKGRKRCKQHGGKSPQGKASPHFKHGIFTRKRELKETRDLVYAHIMSGAIDEREGALEVFALAAGMVAEIEETAGAVDVETEAGQYILKARLAAVSELRQAQKGRVEVLSVLDEETEEKPTSIVNNFYRDNTTVAAPSAMGGDAKPEQVPPR